MLQNYSASMKEFDGYDEERELFEEIKEPVEIHH